ncbi:hypothetical protein [Bradyrhizobium sp. SZCCHNS3053]|uniref:hypothetical protein n=1 Tax=Bradyrhizobium sp. SZCCHNS3053 TaxID=3057322 RepID=UPI002915FA3E|nr:hypothetical protein [Bradyrhizobium sp. SZCCHNS3053]
MNDQPHKHVRVIVAGPISFVATRVETEGKESQLQFRMLCGGKVLADMGEEAARFFIRQAQEAMIGEYADEWIRLSGVNVAVDRDRQKSAETMVG